MVACRCSRGGVAAPNGQSPAPTAISPERLLWIQLRHGARGPPVFQAPSLFPWVCWTLRLEYPPFRFAALAEPPAGPPRDGLRSDCSPEDAHYRFGVLGHGTRLFDSGFRPVHCSHREGTYGRDVDILHPSCYPVNGGFPGLAACRPAVGGEHAGTCSPSFFLARSADRW